MRCTNLESTKCLGFHWRSTHSCPSWKVLEPHQYYCNSQDHDEKHVDLFGTVQWPWGSRCAIVCGPLFFIQDLFNFQKEIPFLINRQQEYEAAPFPSRIWRQKSYTILNHFQHLCSHFSIPFQSASCRNSAANNLLLTSIHGPAS